MISAKRIIDHIAHNEADEIYKENYRVKEYPQSLPPLPYRRHAIIPWSGGLDSTACVLMAIESGVLFSTYYVDYGQEYVQQERACVSHLIETISDQYELNKAITLTECSITDWYHELLQEIGGDWKHIFPFRNLAIILSIIEDYIEHENRADRIGELWFPAVQGEIPYSGGDKSRVFMSYLQRLLYEMNVPVDIVTPVIGMEKSDIVKWGCDVPRRWAALKDTYSCFAGKDIPCGECIACFRKVVAFADNGLLDQLGFTINREYMEKEGRAYVKRFSDHDYYSLRRKSSTKRFLDTLAYHD